jgi:hypothetical protein
MVDDEVEDLWREGGRHRGLHQVSITTRILFADRTTVLLLVFFRNHPRNLRTQCIVMVSLTLLSHAFCLGGESNRYHAPCPWTAIVNKTRGHPPSTLEDVPLGYLIWGGGIQPFSQRYVSSISPTPWPVRKPVRLWVLENPRRTYQVLY